MLKKMMLLVAGSIALGMSTGAAAAPIIYTGSQQLGTVLANYSITTDGTLGDIDVSHLTAYSVTLTDNLSTTAFSRNLSGGTGSDSGTFLASATSLTSPFFETLSLYTNALSAGGSVLGVLNFNYNNTYVQLTDPAHGAGLVQTTPEPNRTVAFATVAAVSAVPEPAMWLTMILGFGLVGGALRSAARRSERKFNARIKRIAAGELA